MTMTVGRRALLSRCQCVAICFRLLCLRVLYGTRALREILVWTEERNYKRRVISYYNIY